MERAREDGLRWREGTHAGLTALLARLRVDSRVDTDARGLSSLLERLAHEQDQHQHAASESLGGLVPNWVKDQFMVTRGVLAGDCKNLLAACGQAAYRKKLAQLESVFQREKSDGTAETMIEASDNVMLAFLLWKEMQADMFAHVRTLTNLPKEDVKTVMQALNKLSTPPAKGIRVLLAHMRDYQQRRPGEFEAQLKEKDKNRLRNTIPPALR